MSRNEESDTGPAFASGSDAGAGGGEASGDEKGGDGEVKSGDGPSDALAVLAEETRVRILRTLAEAERPMAFSELRRAAGIEDAGRFNYHLSRVCEHFVRETESGYELDRAGARLVTAADVEVAGWEQAAEADADAGASAGTGPADAIEPGPGEPCPVCGEPDCGKLFHVHLSPTDPAPR